MVVKVNILGEPIDEAVRLHRVPTRQAEAVLRRSLQRDPSQSLVKRIHPGSGRPGQTREARLPQRPDLARQPQLAPHLGQGRTMDEGTQVLDPH
jgi:hypothetical protein